MRVASSQMAHDALSIADSVGLSVAAYDIIPLYAHAHIQGVTRPVGIVVVMRTKNAHYIYGPDWERKKMFFRSLHHDDLL